MRDDINSPPHYEVAPGLEAWDVIAATLTPDELRGYCLGNILKYRLRAGEKGAADTCIAKANWYRQVLRDLEGSEATAIVGPCGNETKAVRGKPSWESAPTWAQWLAQNESGCWHWFEDEPVPGVRTWRQRGSGIFGLANVGGSTNHQWGATLEARP